MEGSFVDDYADYREISSLYVDKTLLIKEILEKPIRAFIILAPRRFGKSLNASMLKTFFEK